MRPAPPAIKLALGYAAALLALAAVFAAYLQPDFLVTLADRVWACF